MTPIQELLSRIRWDPDFAAATFAIGYYDRVAERVITVPLRDVAFPEGSRFALEITDSEGEAHTVPLHRIRVVYRNGEPIWQRAR